MDIGQSLQKLAWKLKQFGIDSDRSAGDNHYKYKLARMNNHKTNYNFFWWILIDLDGGDVGRLAGQSGG